MVDTQMATFAQPETTIPFLAGTTPPSHATAMLGATAGALDVIGAIVSELETGIPLIDALTGHRDALLRLSARFGALQSEDQRIVRGFHALTLTHVPADTCLATVWGTITRAVSARLTPALPDALTLFTPLLGDTLEAMTKGDTPNARRDAKQPATPEGHPHHPEQRGGGGEVRHGL